MVRRVPRLWASLVEPLFIELNAADVLWRSGIHPRTVLEESMEYLAEADCPICVFDYLELFYSDEEVRSRRDSWAGIVSADDSSVDSMGLSDLHLPALVVELLSDTRALGVIDAQCVSSWSTPDSGNRVLGWEVWRRYLIFPTPESMFAELSDVGHGWSSTVEGFFEIKSGLVRNLEVVIIEYLDGTGRPPDIFPCTRLPTTWNEPSDQMNLVRALVTDLNMGTRRSYVGTRKRSGMIDAGEYYIVLIWFLYYSGVYRSLMRSDQLALIHVIVLRGHAPEVWTSKMLELVSHLWSHNFRVD